MIAQKVVEKQLKQVGCHYVMWGSTEVAELSKILMDDETIVVAVNGYYEGGFGLLVATNFRVLIVDKKPFVLNLEDLRYDMITEVTYGARLIVARLHIAIPTRTIYFDSWSMDKLHIAMRHIQKHVFEARHNEAAEEADWFKARASDVEGAISRQRRRMQNNTVNLAHAACAAAHDESRPLLAFGHRSAQYAVNPYVHRTNRRRLPVF